MAATGWRGAVRWALVAFAAVVLLGQGLAFLSAASGRIEELGDFPGIPTVPGTLPGLSTFQTIQQGALTFETFNHVAITFAFSPGDGGLEGGFFPGGLEFSVQFSFSLVAGTFLAGYLLFVGGRRVAGGLGGPGWARAAHGAKVAVPYAVVAFAYSFLGRMELELPFPGLPPGAEAPTIRPAMASALLWPLAIGLLAGVAGGLSTAAGFTGTRFDRRIRGFIAGGWRMTWVGLALSFLGLLILAAVKPDDTRAYFDLVRLQGVAGGASFLIGTALAVPNMATAITAASMGGSVSADVLGRSCALISYLDFPMGVRESQAAGGPELFGNTCTVLPIDLQVAPAGYFLFLLVPIVATLFGGWHAARRSEATTRGEAAVTGAIAGAAFAIFLLGLMILTYMGVRMSGAFAGFFGGGKFGMGPNMLSGFLVAVLWGVAGGALGGFLATRRAPPPAPAGPPSGGFGREAAGPT